jgi:hypothetical protein
MHQLDNHNARVRFESLLRIAATEPDPALQNRARDFTRTSQTQRKSVIEGAPRHSLGLH